MTMEQLQRGARFAGGPRLEEQRHEFSGRNITTWTNAGYWFAVVDGSDGCGVGDSRQGVIELAQLAIEDGDCGDDED